MGTEELFKEFIQQNPNEIKFIAHYRFAGQVSNQPRSRFLQSVQGSVPEYVRDVVVVTAENGLLMDAYVFSGVQGNPKDNRDLQFMMPDVIGLTLANKNIRYYKSEGGKFQDAIGGVYPPSSTVQSIFPYHAPFLYCELLLSPYREGGSYTEFDVSDGYPFWDRVFQSETLKKFGRSYVINPAKNFLDLDSAIETGVVIRDDRGELWVDPKKAEFASRIRLAWAVMEDDFSRTQKIDHQGQCIVFESHPLASDICMVTTGDSQGFMLSWGKSFRRGETKLVCKQETPSNKDALIVIYNPQKGVTTFLPYHTEQQSISPEGFTRIGLVIMSQNAPDTKVHLFHEDQAVATKLADGLKMWGYKNVNSYDFSDNLNKVIKIK